MAKVVGYALCFNVKWKKCEIESCLMYSKRKNWVFPSEWKKYTPNTSFGEFDGFKESEIIKLLGPYLRLAQNEVPH